MYSTTKSRWHEELQSNATTASAGRAFSPKKKKKNGELYGAFLLLVAPLKVGATHPT